MLTEMELKTELIKSLQDQQKLLYAKIDKDMNNLFDIVNALSNNTTDQVQKTKFLNLTIEILKIWKGYES